MNVTDNNKPFPTWTDLGIVVGVFVAALLLAGACTMVFHWVGVKEQGLLMFLSETIQMGLMLVFIVIYRRWRKAPMISLIGQYRKSSPMLLLWGVVLMVVASIVIEPLLGTMPDYWMKLISDSIGRGGWAIAATVIAAPILEELLFRGYILGSIRTKWGATSAIVISAAMFGVIHFIPQQVVNAFVLGLILGYIYIRSGSLVVVILMHAINNAIAYIQMQLGAESLRGIIANNTLYWIIYAAAAVAAGFAIYGIVKALKKMRVES